MSKSHDHGKDGGDHDHDQHDHGGHDDCTCGTPYDPRYFGSYGGDSPPKYEPHCLEHSCFRVPPEDYVPPRGCPPPCKDEDEARLRARRDQASLSQDEINRFLGAFQALVSGGFMGPFVDIHANMAHRMHRSVGAVGAQRFLPWHRVYLVKLEEMLRTVEPSVTLPYWRWTRDRAVPAWVAGFLPTMVLQGTPHTVTRTPGDLTPDLPTDARVATALGNATYEGFTVSLEGAHDTVHVWVGGSMSTIRTAPADPLFWMHHCEIDRLWNEWQQTHALNPALAGVDAVMDPWPETEANTRSIAAMGYRYV